MERVAILIDGNNMAHGSRRHGVMVDYGTLLAWCARGGPRTPKGVVRRGLGYQRQIVLGRIYLGPCHSDDGRRGAFIRAMEELGLEVVICAEEGDGSKTAVDRDIILDAMSLANWGRVDRILLLSGDGGYTRLVSMVRALGVQVEVCAFPDASGALQGAADLFWSLPELAGATLVRDEAQLEELHIDL